MGTDLRTGYQELLINDGGLGSKFCSRGRDLNQEKRHSPSFFLKCQGENKQVSGKYKITFWPVSKVI